MEDLALLGLRGGGTEKYLDVLDHADSTRGFLFFYFFMNTPLLKYALLLLYLLGLEGHLSYGDYNENSTKRNVWKLVFSFTVGDMFLSHLRTTSISKVILAAQKVSIAIEPNTTGQT